MPRAHLRSFDAEVWAANRRRDEPLPESVEGQPDRRECLSVLEMRKVGKTLQHVMYLADILRHGDVIDIGPAEKLEEVETSLLASFFAGVGSAGLSDQDLLEMMKNVHDQGGNWRGPDVGGPGT
jgi:hypothetical protein